MSSQRLEIIYRNQLSSLLLNQGWNVFLPVYDDGIDMIAHRGTDGAIRLVQQKGRWTIMKKYIGRHIWVAFPEGADWYLAPHDDMVGIGDEKGYTATASWIDGAAYSIGSLGIDMRGRHATHLIGSVTLSTRDAPPLTAGGVA